MLKMIIDSPNPRLNAIAAMPCVHHQKRCRKGMSDSAEDKLLTSLHILSAKCIGLSASRKTFCAWKNRNTAYFRSKEVIANTMASTTSKQPILLKCMQLSHQAYSYPLPDLVGYLCSLLKYMWLLGSDHIEQGVSSPDSPAGCSGGGGAPQPSQLLLQLRRPCRGGLHCPPSLSLWRQR